MEFEEFMGYKPWISFIGVLGVHAQLSCPSSFVLISFLFLAISKGGGGGGVFIGNMMGAGETPKIPLQGGLCI